MISPETRRSILQFLMLERMMTYNDFTDLISRVVGRDSDLDVQGIVDILNERIGRFSQKIVMTTSEISGEKVVVLASTADQAEIKSSLSKEHLDYFYRLMDNIITGEGMIPFISALNLAPTFARITISEGDKALKSFIQKKLLVWEGEHLFLSPLSIVELRPYITENYSIENCLFCKNIVIAGEPCPNCSAAMHRPCARAYTAQKKRAKCPQCKHEWPSASEEVD